MNSLFNLKNAARLGKFRFPYDENTLVGTVIRAGINKKTVVVMCSFRKRDQKFERTYTVNKHYQVHDEHSFCALGDKVVIRKCPGYTKTKHFFVEQLLRAAGRKEIEPIDRDISEGKWLDRILAEDK